MFLITLAMLTSELPAAPPPTLAYFVGKWRCDGNMVPSGRPISSIIEFVWDVQTASLIKSHSDAPPGKYNAAERWAYTPELKIFRAAINASSSGMRFYNSPGWAGQVLTWSRARAEGERDDAFAYRRVGPDEMRVDWSVDRNGAGLTIGDTLDCRRSS